MAFRDLVGGDGWFGLRPAIRERFDRLSICAETDYAGEMDVETNLAGRLFAMAARLFGAPLPRRTGQGVKTQVVVGSRKAGMCWDRRMFHPGGTEIIRSLKLVDPRLGLLECVDGGLGMALKVTAENGALVFRSQRYFLELGLIRLPIPVLFSPGQATVEHIDLDGRHFRFRLTMNHKLFGQTIRQDGVFLDPDAS